MIKSAARQKLSFGFVAEYLINEVNYDDFNDYQEHGIFSIQRGSAKENAPSGTIDHGFLMNFAWEKARSLQVFFVGYPDCQIYMRRYDGNSWNNWVRFAKA